MKLARMTLATASSVLLLSALAACGSSSDDTTATDQGTTQTGQTGQQPQGGTMPGGGFPGTSGLVAAVDGKTAQVQSAQSGQVAVSWTSDTTFTQQVDASLDDVEVGATVMVTSADSDSDSDADATEITAASVRILPEGAANMMGGGGNPPQGAPSGMPTDRPSDMPTDMPQGQRPGGFGAFGEVTAVSADGFTVSVTTPGSDSDSSEVTVTVTGDTTYTTTGDATSAAVKTGVCVSAQGDSDDTGALSATSISVTKAVDGQCSGGFGGAAS